jgi:hypothetical protein
MSSADQELKNKPNDGPWDIVNSGGWRDVPQSCEYESIEQLFGCLPKLVVERYLRKAAGYELSAKVIADQGLVYLLDITEKCVGIPPSDQPENKRASGADEEEER